MLRCRQGHLVQCSHYRDTSERKLHWAWWRDTCGTVCALRAPGLQHWHCRIHNSGKTRQATNSRANANLVYGVIYPERSCLRVSSCSWGAAPCDPDPLGHTCAPEEGEVGKKGKVWNCFRPWPTLSRTHQLQGWALVDSHVLSLLCCSKSLSTAWHINIMIVFFNLMISILNLYCYIIFYRKVFSKALHSCCKNLNTSLHIYTFIYISFFCMHLLLLLDHFLSWSIM